MKNIVFIVVVAFFQNAQAIGDFSGHWIADSGEVKSNVGLSSTCSKIEVIIEQTDTTIVTKKYESTCKLYGSSWGPFVQTIEDGKVYEDDEQVGIVDDTKLTSTSPSGTATYIYNLILGTDSKGERTLTVEYGVKNYVGTIITYGTFYKQ
ncbi:hypothetical protein K2X05_06400 [bacterium]|nr:hypothetical protein [bacterium]